jgi:hypothetical protein
MRAVEHSRVMLRRVFTSASHDQIGSITMPAVAVFPMPV